VIAGRINYLKVTSEPQGHTIEMYLSAIIAFTLLYEPFRRFATSVDLIEDCKKATSIHFFVSQESQVKRKKQNGYNNIYSSCSIALIANYRPMHKIEQRTTGAISVIRQTASARDQLQIRQLVSGISNSQYYCYYNRQPMLRPWF